MSLPVTPEEKRRYSETVAGALPGENVVSTACPECHTRFAMLATWKRDASGKPDWFLRCVVCGTSCKGELKPMSHSPGGA